MVAVVIATIPLWPFVLPAVIPTVAALVVVYRLRRRLEAVRGILRPRRARAALPPARSFAEISRTRKLTR